jgi:HTH-type transcriptional regulator, transcriptional repressor of NAD biosynthesis genes
MIRGFITGSFRPFHKGHEALIDYAKANCDELTILITTLPDEVIPYKYRLKWVLSTYLDDPRVQIVADTVKEPSLTGDALSIWWGMYVTQKFGQFDRVFTSEDYGWTFAEAMGAVHFPFDKARAQVPVSATLIREKPLTYWNYLNNFAKDYFVKKIAIIGTESTGKTVMCKQLAEHYNTIWAPEVGRDLVPDTRECKPEDLINVGIEHAKGIIRQTRHANKILFVDTDVNITKSYSQFLFGHRLKFEPWVETANKCDGYIYLNNSAPWVDDGTRMKKEKRDLLDKNHQQTFIDAGISFLSYSFATWVPAQEAYDKRLANVIRDIDEFISRY